MSTVIKACVIIHNMNIDYERVNGLDRNYINSAEYVPKHPFVLIEKPRTASTFQLIQEMQDSIGHARLQNDVMIALWDAWSNDNGYNM